MGIDALVLRYIPLIGNVAAVELASIDGAIVPNSANRSEMDAATVESLFRANAAGLVVQLRRQYSTIRDAAPDAVQHAFGKLAASDVPIRDPMSWVARSANNFMIDVLRRGKRWNTVGASSQFEQWLPPDLSAVDDEDDERQIRAEALMRALKQIDEPMLTALIMMYMKGCNYRQIAEATGLALASVGTILLRGRKRLRALVDVELRSGPSLRQAGA